MRTLRLRQTRWLSRMGRILTHVTIVNALDPAHEISCEALVDTGAWGLMLPRAWKERLGAFQMTRTVEMVTADQRVVSGEVCGPVTIQIEGCEAVSSEVTFVDMELEGGRYRPLLGYTVLEQAGLAPDPVGGRLLKIPHMDLRAASGSTG